MEGSLGFNHDESKIHTRELARIPVTQTLLNKCPCQTETLWTLLKTCVYCHKHFKGHGLGMNLCLIWMMIKSNIDDICAVNRFFLKIIESLYCYQHGLKIAIIYTYCDKYQCCVVLCCMVLCCVVLGYVGLCWAMLCYVVLCCAMLCYVVLCCAMSCHVMSCHTHVMSIHVMLCHVMLCTTFMYAYIPRQTFIRSICSLLQDDWMLDISFGDSSIHLNMVERMCL